MSNSDGRSNADSLEKLERLRRLVHLHDLVCLTMDTEFVEELTVQRRWWVHPINQRRIEQGASEQLVREMMLCDEDEFFSYTRMSMSQFQELLLLVGPLMLKQNTRKDVLSPYIRLLITLRYLATGESFASLHFTFRAGKTTIGKVVHSTCHAIKDVLQPICLPALTKNRLNKFAEGFEKRTSYPHIIGAIDGIY